MRRKNREVKNTEELLEIINGCKVCRVGMVDAGKPYVIPMNFGYQLEESSIIIYLHSAKEGKKIEVLKSNSQICIEMDVMREMITGEKGCDYSCYFESFIGNGTAVFLDDEASKTNALDAIMKHQTGRTDFNYDKHVLDQTALIAVKLSDYSGKKH